SSPNRTATASSLGAVLSKTSQLGAARRSELTCAGMTDFRRAEAAASTGSRKYTYPTTVATAPIWLRTIMASRPPRQAQTLAIKVDISRYPSDLPASARL